MKKEELDKTRLKEGLKEKLNKLIEEADELTLLMNEDYCTFYEKHAKRMYDLQILIKRLRKVIREYKYPIK